MTLAILPASTGTVKLLVTIARFLHLCSKNSLRNKIGLIRVRLPLPGDSHIYRDCVTHGRIAYRAGAGGLTIRVGDAITRRCCRFEFPSGVHRRSSDRLFVANKKAKHCHVLILAWVLIINPCDDSAGGFGESARRSW